MMVAKDTTRAQYLISNNFAFINVNAFLVAIAFITLLARTRETPWGVTTNSILVANFSLTLIDILAVFLLGVRTLKTPRA